MKPATKEILCGLVSSIRLLTNLPCPGHDAEHIESSRSWFPIVGLILGSLIVSAGLLTNLATAGWYEITAFVMITLSAWLTRGFHLDGLSDCADGFWGGFNPEKILYIMKDSCVGAFGSIAMILIILGKWIALTRLVEYGEWHWIIAALVISRTMQVLLASTQPYARPEGGTGAKFITHAQPRNSITSLIIMYIILILIIGINLTTFIIPVIAIALTFSIGTWSRRRIGGITGDILGTVNEITELAVLVVAACAAGGTV